MTFRKLLIANRGEIACRVIRTARRMGIATVAVFSDADAHALHVGQADEAYRIGPAAARESYLRGDIILDVARGAGADALHPGYGFLSENADFAEACAAAGIVFVGPPPAAIRAMGGKSESKALMERAGVPTVPGYHGEAQDAATLAAAAARIGYPVLIKASAGGGGKGMRIVERADDLADAVAGAKREAASSFGDDRILIERYLQHPRHIEVQVFADTQGNCVSLFERDCSIQRRHQKVIEEAPAPGMTPARRAAMGEAAVAAARAVGYVGAGTVEFIAEGDAFHFMEMNTRLQVEHPVTEAIIGQDLVEWQLRVAAGEPLPLRADALRIDGHAFEARIYAEDPAHDFMPSVGVLHHLRFPPPGEGVRVDTGVREGDRIGSDYDPMIAKLIVHGPTRAAALDRLAVALRGCEVVGVQTNLALLRALAGHPAFRAGEVETGFIGQHPEVLGTVAPAVAPEAFAAATIASFTPPLVGGARGGEATSRVLGAGSPLPQAEGWGGPWDLLDSWRMNLEGSRAVVLRCGDETVEVRASRIGDKWRLAWNGASYLASLSEDELRLDGAVRRIRVRDAGGRIAVIIDGHATLFDIVDPLAPPRAGAAAGGRVAAPIPGRVVAVLVQPGDAVVRGQKLVVVEAMKMEMSLTSPVDGEVAAVDCVAGDMVDEGRELVVVTSPAT